MRYQPIAATALALVLVGAGAISASAVDWDGGAGGGAINWSSVANWNPDGVPAANSALVFATGGVESNFDLASGYAVGGITFNLAGGFAIHHQTAGEGITLNGGLDTLTASGASYFVDVPILVAPLTSTWNIGGTDKLSLTEPVTINPASNLTLTTQTNALISFNDALNGGAVTKDGGGDIVLVGGGNIGALTIMNGAVQSASVTADMDVVNTGGYLTGGAANLLCADQLVGGVDLQAGYISPGQVDIYGAGIGHLCVNGSFDGNDNSTYLLDVDGTTSDLIDANGAFDPNGTWLDLATATVPAVNTVLTIAQAAGGIDPGFFRDENGDPIADEAVFEADGQFYRMHYNTVDITLTYLGNTAPVEAPALAATGVDVGTGTLLAGFLVLAGAGTIFASTRRREV